MMDALLFGMRDAIRTLPGAGYAAPNVCDVMADGEPPPRCGNMFVAVHQGRMSNESVENLDEYYGISVTLTMRVTVPKDRVGDQLLARKLAKRIGFNARCQQLRAYLHKNWSVLKLANQYLMELSPDEEEVYGFAEPLVFQDMEVPHFVYGDWFASTPEATNVGLVSELTFDRARRLQPIGSFV